MPDQQDTNRRSNRRKTTTRAAARHTSTRRLTTPAGTRRTTSQAPAAQQLALDLKPAGRGGARPGAGRPAAPGARVLHRTRERVPGYCPVHVTVKVGRDIPKLRNGAFVRAFRRSLAECSVRPGFRVVHYSIQQNHCHFLIEAHGKGALANGMKSLGARLARTANRVFGRAGAVLRGRYHARVLRTPLEVRRALAYVLLNHRHHAGRPGRPALDGASSGVWFDGWKDVDPARPPRTPEVALPRTWLLRAGWRKHRLIRLAELPGRRR